MILSHKLRKWSSLLLPIEKLLEAVTIQVDHALEVKEGQPNQWVNLRQTGW